MTYNASMSEKEQKVQEETPETAPQTAAKTEPETETTDPKTETNEPKADEPSIDGPSDDLALRAKLTRKMANVISKTGKVEKKGTNTEQKYKFASHSDIIQELRKIIADEGIYILPKPRSYDTREIKSKYGTLGQAVIMQMDFEIIDTETGYCIPVRWFGEGHDYGDKAIYKSYTGALKYFLLDTFMISTGDDPENENPENHQSTAPTARPAAKPAQPVKPVFKSMTENQKAKINNLLAEKNKTIDDMKKYVQGRFGLNDWEKMSFGQAGMVINKIQEMPNPDEEVDPDEVEKGIEEQKRKEAEAKKTPAQIEAEEANAKIAQGEEQGEK